MPSNLKFATENCLSNFLDIKAFSSRYKKPQEFGVTSHSIFLRREGDQFKIEQGFELKHYVDPENFVEKILTSLNKTQVLGRKFRNPSVTADIIYATNNEKSYWWVRFIILVDWNF